MVSKVFAWSKVPWNISGDLLIPACMQATAGGPAAAVARLEGSLELGHAVVFNKRLVSRESQAASTTVAQRREAVRQAGRAREQMRQRRRHLQLGPCCKPANNKARQWQALTSRQPGSHATSAGPGPPEADGSVPHHHHAADAQRASVPAQRAVHAGARLRLACRKQSTAGQRRGGGALACSLHSHNSLQRTLH